MTYEEATELALINPELKDAVLKNMPKNFTKLEQTLYIYSKLCSILNYDPQFLASNQTAGPKNETHKSVDYIKSITTENTDVVCYNFNIIFAKFLNEIEMDNYIFTGFSKSLKFGAHADIAISFNSKDIGQEFDKEFQKVYFYGHSDMKHIKVNHNIFPSCDMNCDDKFREFLKEKKEEIVSLVIKEQENENNHRKQQAENQEQITKLEEEYKNIEKNIVNIDEEEKLKTFLAQVKSVDLNKYDSLFYIEKMFKNMNFSKNSNSIYTYSILKEQSKKNPDLYNMISILSICNDKEDFYIKIIPPNKMESIEPKKLQQAFDSGKIDYINFVIKEEAIIPHIISKTAESIFAINYETKLKSINDLKKNNQNLLSKGIDSKNLITEQTEAYKIHKNELEKSSPKKAPTL